MKRGRPPSITGLVEALDGSEEAKRRLALILETLTGRRTVAEAGQELGLSRSRLHALRTQVLQLALDAVQPRGVGRPAKGPTPEAVSSGQDELKSLRVELQAARVREEITLALPHLFRRHRPDRAPPRTHRPRHDEHGAARN